MTYTLADLIAGHEEVERAVVFVPNGERSMLRFIGMDREELTDYLMQVAVELKHRGEIDEQLRRIAGSERAQ